MVLSIFRALATHANVHGSRPAPHVDADGFIAVDALTDCGNGSPVGVVIVPRLDAHGVVGHRRRRQQRDAAVGAPQEFEGLLARTRRPA
jgi:hypothetical protein